MKLQTCRNDLSYTNALYFAQQLPRFLIFIEKKSTLKSNLHRTTSTDIIANVNTPKTPAKNINVKFWYLHRICKPLTRNVGSI